MFKVFKQDGATIVTCKNLDGFWTNLDCKRLWEKYHILFDSDGIFAIEIVNRKNANPLVRIAVEDDGIISFTNYRGLQFDISWLGNLKILLEQIKGDNNDGNNERTT